MFVFLLKANFKLFVRYHILIKKILFSKVTGVGICFSHVSKLRAISMNTHYLVCLSPYSKFSTATTTGSTPRSELARKQRCERNEGSSKTPSELSSIPYIKLDSEVTFTAISPTSWVRVILFPKLVVNALTSNKAMSRRILNGVSTFLCTNTYYFWTK